MFIFHPYLRTWSNLTNIFFQLGASTTNLSSCDETEGTESKHPYFAIASHPSIMQSCFIVYAPWCTAKQVVSRCIDVPITVSMCWFAAVSQPTPLTSAQQHMLFDMIYLMIYLRTSWWVFGSDVSLWPSSCAQLFWYNITGWCAIKEQWHGSFQQQSNSVDSNCSALGHSIFIPI